MFTGATATDAARAENVEAYEDMVDRIKQHEGFRQRRYPCPAGFETMGYGFNVDAGISREVADALLRAQLQEAQDWLSEEVARHYSVDYDRLPHSVQSVVLEMAFQLGVAGACSFRKMWIAIRKGDYTTAAAEMRDSKWYTQTPDRCTRLADLMAYGDANHVPTAETPAPPAASGASGAGS